MAYQCLWGLGFQSTDTRVLVHSILGCVFYGVFVTKVMAVRMHGLPDRTLPLVGGFVFAVLVGIWLTSSVWFFTSGPAPRPALLMFKRIVNVVEVLAVIAAAVFLVLLFANEPDSGGDGGGGNASPGAALFASNCARCHGGDGGGGLGPQLSDGKVADDLTEAEEIARRHQWSERHAVVRRCAHARRDPAGGGVHTDALTGLRVPRKAGSKWQL